MLLADALQFEACSSRTVSGCRSLGLVGFVDRCLTVCSQNWKQLTVGKPLEDFERVITKCQKLITLNHFGWLLRLGH